MGGIYDTLPAYVGNMTSLRVLGLDLSTLKKVPTEIGMLSKLTMLNLAEGDFDEALPTQIGAMTSLKFMSLRLSENIPNLLPSLFEPLKRLSVLDVSGVDNANCNHLLEQSCKRSSMLRVRG